MSLQNISQLGNPAERVPLDHRKQYESGLELIASGGFEAFELQLSEAKTMSLQMFWHDEQIKKNVTVNVFEHSSKGTLDFNCSHCLEAGRQARGCAHQWASFVLLWQAVTENETAEIKNTELKSLSEKLKGPDYLGAFDEQFEKFAEFANVKLESISLFLDEPPLLKGASLTSVLKDNLESYKVLKESELTNDKVLLSPRLWNLPEIFHRKLTGFSEHYFNEISKQMRLVDIIRYNFSNGMQIGAKEILRHPLQKKVHGGFLPQAKSTSPGASVFDQWPLIQQSHGQSASRNLNELEVVMQSLLGQIAAGQRQNRVQIYIQSHTSVGRALKVKTLEFDPTPEIAWRIYFSEKKHLETEIRLLATRKKPFYFFESFAVQPEDGVVLVHPWKRELSQLQEVLSKISNNLFLPDLVPTKEMPAIDLVGESEAKTVLKHLRMRSIPVLISGESHSLGAHQSLTEIRLNECGQFYLQHEARVAGQRNLARKGWTSTAELYLQTLSQGLSYFLGAEAKDVATRSRSKREWDMKLLKHLGILQYLFLEALSLRFEGTLIDGTSAQPETLFARLEPKVQSLLTAGAVGAFVEKSSLSELCSKSVLVCFDDFLQSVFRSFDTVESFYSENGEVIMDGLVEREFRLIYELLKKMALVSIGEAFKKSRTSFLSKISNKPTTTDLIVDPDLKEALFFFPTGDSQTTSSVHSSLESMQLLIPYGFKIFYKDQPLQELTEDEFHVDFNLQSDTQDKFFNWFELNPKFFLRGEEVDPENFLSLGGGGVVEYEGKLFLVPKKQMPSLRRLETFWQKLQKGKTENGKKKNGENIYQLPRSQTLELLALRSSGVNIKGDAEWKKLCDFYDNLGQEKPDLVLPKSVKAQLKPYQLAGVQWLKDLYNLKLGALLADDMGLGKTLQTLSFLDDLRDKDELGAVLVVVPSSLIFNWQNEVEKFTPELPLSVFNPKDRENLARRLNNKESGVIIITYGLLMEHEDFLNQFKWKVLIFDEAQNLKNLTTRRTSSARSLTAQFKICLTGTPMENHYGEFYSLVDLLVPGSLGRIDEFRRQFVNRETVSREEIEDLKLKIKPLLLRRTKKEILDQLPEKQETKVSIAFEERQKEIYRDIALAYNQRIQETMAVQGEASVQLQMLTALLRLRQACSDPAALPNVKYDKVPPKLETLLDSLQEIVESGESALVFTQFLQTLEHTAAILRKANIPVFVLHGGVPTAQRQKILTEFNKTEGGAVLVMTLKTGGVGLNLTKASYVFHLEPWWNPAVENQATDRAHRLGQSKAVQVFRYIMHESLEEKIELLKDRKDRKFQSLFSNTEKEVDLGAGTNSLSKSDFDILLGID